MSTEIAVLRALLFFSRRSTPPTHADLLARVGGTAAELDRALAALVRAELVMHVKASVRLTLSGLAVAAAAAASARRAKTVARPSSTTRAPREGRVIPMIARRVRAA